MPFKPGDPKPANSGRRKGQKNKKPSLTDLKSAILETGFDTAEEMVELYHKAEDEGTKFKILDLILRYTQPLPAKVQPEKPSGEDDEPDLTEYSEEELDAILEEVASENSTR